MLARRSLNVVRLSFGNKLKSWRPPSVKRIFWQTEHVHAEASDCNSVHCLSREYSWILLLYEQPPLCSGEGGWEGMQTDVGQKESAWILSWSPLDVYSCLFVSLGYLGFWKQVWMQSCSIAFFDYHHHHYRRSAWNDSTPSLLLAHHASSTAKLAMSTRIKPFNAFTIFDKLHQIYHTYRLHIWKQQIVSTLHWITKHAMSLSFRVSSQPWTIIVKQLALIIGSPTQFVV